MCQIYVWKPKYRRIQIYSLDCGEQDSEAPGQRGLENFRNNWPADKKGFQIISRLLISVSERK